MTTHRVGADALTAVYTRVPTELWEQLTADADGLGIPRAHLIAMILRAGRATVVAQQAAILDPEGDLAVRLGVARLEFPEPPKQHAAEAGRVGLGASNRSRLAPARNVLGEHEEYSSRSEPRVEDGSPLGQLASEVERRTRR